MKQITSKSTSTPIPSRIDPFVRPAPHIEGVRISDGDTLRFFYGPPQAIIDIGLAHPSWFGGHRGRNGKWYSMRRTVVMGLHITTSTNEDMTDCRMDVSLGDERRQAAGIPQLPIPRWQSETERLPDGVIQTTYRGWSDDGRLIHISITLRGEKETLISHGHARREWFPDRAKITGRGRRERSRRTNFGVDSSVRVCMEQEGRYEVHRSGCMAQFDATSVPVSEPRAPLLRLVRSGAQAA